MERRLVLFAVTAFAVILGYNLFIAWLFPPKPRRCRRRRPPLCPTNEPKAAPRSRNRRRSAAAGQNRRGGAGNQGPARAESARTMGHARLGRRERSLPDVGHAHQSRGRRGADRAEQPALLRHRQPQRLSGPSRDGRVRFTRGGCLVQLVGPGTPAAEAGLKPGDVIKAVAGKPVDGRQSLDAVLAKTKPGQKVHARRSCATERN